MQRIINLLLSNVMLPKTAALVLVLLRPLQRTQALTEAQFKELVLHAGGASAAPPALTPYTAAEVQEIVLHVKGIVADVLQQLYGFTLTVAEMDRLLTAVGNRIVVP